MTCAIIIAAAALAVGGFAVCRIGRTVDQQTDTERYRRMFGEYGDEGEGL